MRQRRPFAKHWVFFLGGRSCGNAGLLPGLGCLSGGELRAPGGEERKVAKVHKNVIIVKVFWVWVQVALGYKPQVIHESEAKIAQKLNGALQKCSK